MEIRKRHPLSIASLLAGLGTIPFLYIMISGFDLVIITLILGLFAIISGCVSLYKIKRDPLNFIGKGMSIVGIILGIISILLLALLGLILFVVFNFQTI